MDVLHHHQLVFVGDVGHRGEAAAEAGPQDAPAGLALGRVRQPAGVALRGVVDARQQDVGHGVLFAGPAFAPGLDLRVALRADADVGLGGRAGLVDQRGDDRVAALGQDPVHVGGGLHQSASDRAPQTAHAIDQHDVHRELLSSIRMSGGTQGPIRELPVTKIAERIAVIKSFFWAGAIFLTTVTAR